MKDYLKQDRAIKAFSSMRKKAECNGFMSDEEIEKEVLATREEKFYNESNIQRILNAKINLDAGNGVEHDLIEEE